VFTVSERVAASFDRVFTVSERIAASMDRVSAASPARGGASALSLPAFAAAYASFASDRGLIGNPPEIVAAPVA
jgi:hypothetical protein